METDGGSWTSTGYTITKKYLYDDARGCYVFLYFIGKFDAEDGWYWDEESKTYRDKNDPIDTTDYLKWNPEWGAMPEDDASHREDGFTYYYDGNGDLIKIERTLNNGVAEYDLSGNPLSEELISYGYDPFVDGQQFTIM